MKKIYNEVYSGDYKQMIIDMSYLWFTLLAFIYHEFCHLFIIFILNIEYSVNDFKFFTIVKSETSIGVYNNLEINISSTSKNLRICAMAPAYGILIYFIFSIIILIYHPIISMIMLLYLILSFDIFWLSDIDIESAKKSKIEIELKKIKS